MAASHAADMRDRLVPSPAQLLLAQAALAAVPGASLAAVPIALPGKTRGWWTAGQPVEHVNGCVFLGIDAPVIPADSDLPTWPEARHLASAAARARLAGRPGTVAWAAVDRDGTWSVTEDH